MGIMLVVLGGTFTAMTNAMRAEQTARSITTLNGHLRSSMDLRGARLPADRPGPADRAASSACRTAPARRRSCGPVRPRPAAAPASRTFPVAPTISAVTVGPDLGPPINGQCTDVITTLAVDGVFDERQRRVRSTANGQSHHDSPERQHLRRARRVRRQPARRRPPRSCAAGHVRPAIALRHRGGRPDRHLRARRSAAGSTSSTRPASWWARPTRSSVAPRRSNRARHRWRRHPDGAVGGVPGPDDHLLRGHDHQPDQPAPDAPDQRQRRQRGGLRAGGASASPTTSPTASSNPSASG